MRYLLDSNVLIEGRKRHYGMDFCPAFWSFLVQQNAKGTVCSVDKVKVELARGHDELKDWANQRSGQFFVSLPAGAAPHLKRLTTWAVNQGDRYSDGARRVFLDSADYQLIALAAHCGDVVVTHEVTDQKITRVKIPDACHGVSVRYVAPWDMLRQLGARFVLPGSS